MIYFPRFTINNREAEVTVVVLSVTGKILKFEWLMKESKRYFVHHLYVLI